MLLRAAAAELASGARSWNAALQVRVEPLAIRYRRVLVAAVAAATAAVAVVVFGDNHLRRLDFNIVERI